MYSCRWVPSLSIQWSRVFSRSGGTLYEWLKVWEGRVSISLEEFYTREPPLLAVLEHTGNLGHQATLEGTAELSDKGQWARPFHCCPRRSGAQHDDDPHTLGS